MHTKNIRIFPLGLLGAWLWLVPVASLAFTACDAEPVKVSVTMEADYSQIIEAVNSSGQTLTTKMSLIESALSQGFANDKQAQDLLRQAVEAMDGTASEKLAAVETAVKSGTTSLEMKLGLIEAAVTNGFANRKDQLALIKSAIVSLSGTLAEKMASVEAAINSQTTSLETKLGVIETALTEGLAGEKQAQSLMLQAVETLEGTAEGKLKALETAVKNGTASLETKLGLIDAALEKGLADNEDSLLLIQTALDALDGTLESKLASLESALSSETTGLGSKISLIAAAVNKGFADASQQQALILQALDALDGTLDAKLKAISSAITNRKTALETKLGLIEAAVKKGFYDHLEAQSKILEALNSLDDKTADCLATIASAISSQTLELWTQLGLIETSVTNGMINEAEALDQITEAINKSLIKKEGDGEYEGNVAGIVSQIQKMETTLTETVPQFLSNIFDAIDGLTDYREILVAINQALYNMTEHSINGYDYVEMAPGLKWATMNVGATRPDEIGNYYAWGELDPKAEYTWENYKFWEYDNHQYPREYSLYLTKYTFDDWSYSARWYNWGNEFYGDGAIWLGEPMYNYADDVARWDWGSSWHIPTYDEWATLFDTEHYEWKWTDSYKGTGVAGMLVTSWIEGCEGRQIFFPAAGWKDGSDSVTDWNCYWSSSLGSYSFNAGACCFNASEHQLPVSTMLRKAGLQVRPVSN